MNSTFDLTAPTFERYRSFPEGVPEAIRAAIWSGAELTGQARVLDVGAGTGRIGKAFVAAGDLYCGMDTSQAMLQEFVVNSENCTLTVGDGSHLPFADGSFDVVLLMQILNGADDWKGIVSEARRVARGGGSVVVGHTINPESGIDAQLKSHLKGILEELGVERVQSEQSRRRALEWLDSAAMHHIHLAAATWNVITTPEAFLQRHRTGARFAALHTDLQEQALHKLRGWAELTFGSLHAEFTETRSFEVDIFGF